jgi:hypothetical protein
VLSVKGICYVVFVVIVYNNRDCGEGGKENLIRKDKGEGVLLRVFF